MQPAQVLERFTTCAALLEGHFQLSAGLHSAGYLQCARVLQHPNHATELGEALADKVRNWEPSVVLSPALGGIVIGHEVARALGVRAIFAERRDGRLSLRRGFQIAYGERALVVEDVVTTGGSTQEIVALAREAGANVVAASAVINRGGSSVDVGVPLAVLANVTWAAYKPESCPLCTCGVPLTVPGSRPQS